MGNEEKAHEILDKIIKSNDFHEVTELREQLNWLLDEISQTRVEAHIRENYPHLWTEYLNYKEKKK